MSTHRPLNIAFADALKSQSREEGTRLVAVKLESLLRDRKTDRVSIRDEVKAELFDFETEVMEAALKQIGMLATEQWRQREAIKLYLHGRLTREELRNVSSNWNGDKL